MSYTQNIQSYIKKNARSIQHPRRRLAPGPARPGPARPGGGRKQCQPLGCTLWAGWAHKAMNR